ncbi:MAG: hypothetical protein ACK5HR_03040, partial [Mycoplasmatales bacterium]
PFLFIYLYKGYKSNKFLLLLLLAGLGLTSSMTYVYLFFLPIYLGYEVFINKKYQVRDFLGKVMMLLLPILIVAECILVKSTPTIAKEVLINKTLIYVLIFLVVEILLYIVYKRTKIETTDKNLFKMALVTYLILTLMLILFIFVTIPIITLTIISQTLDITFWYNKDHLYLNNGLFSLLYVLGLYVAYKRDKRLLLLHVIVGILVVNHLLYKTIGAMIGMMSYTRITIFVSYYLFVILGLIFIIDKIFAREYKIKNFVINKKSYAVIVIFLVVFVGIQSKEIYKFNEPFIDYKLRSADVIQLVNYDFVSPNIQIIDPEVPSETEEEKSQEVDKKSKDAEEEITERDIQNQRNILNQIFELNTSLINVEECTQDCYIIETKDTKKLVKNQDNIVYETPNYTLKYLE